MGALNPRPRSFLSRLRKSVAIPFLNWTRIRVKIKIVSDNFNSARQSCVLDGSVSDAKLINYTAPLISQTLPADDVSARWKEEKLNEGETGEERRAIDLFSVRARAYSPRMRIKCVSASAPIANPVLLEISDSPFRTPTDQLYRVLLARFSYFSSRHVARLLSF